MSPNPTCGRGAGGSQPLSCHGSATWNTPGAAIGYRRPHPCFEEHHQRKVCRQLFSPQLVPDVRNELASKALDIRSPSYSSASIAKRGDRERSFVEEHRNDFAT